MDYHAEQTTMPMASKGVLSGVAGQRTEQTQTVAGRLNLLLDNLERVTSQLDYTADRLLGRPSSDCAEKAAPGSAPLPVLADRLQSQVDRLAKINEQISEIA